MKQAFYLITGVMAAGKSTVAERLSAEYPKCAHVRGDAFRRMIASGRADMSAAPSDEAIRQLYLRYDLAANAAKGYFDGGFSVVLQDNYYGEALTYLLARLEKYPVRTVVLCPSVETVEARERARGKTGYTGFAVALLNASFLAETPKIGFWLDSSDQTPEETVRAILKHFEGTPDL